MFICSKKIKQVSCGCDAIKTENIYSSMSFFKMELIALDVFGPNKRVISEIEGGNAIEENEEETLQLITS